MEERDERVGEESCDASGGRGNRTWTFRGYQLDLSHFTAAMVHFYRAEVTRSNTWRTRLDATTNWAVVTVGAVLTFVFGQPQNPHFILLLALLLVLTFLSFEARRYRYYVLWAYRVRLMETDFFAPMLAPPFRPSSDWAHLLVDSLHEPTFPISWGEAIGRRLRRNYILLVTLLLISWWAKLTIHPWPTSSVNVMIERAAIGPISGTWMVVAVGAIYGGLVMLTVASHLFSAWRGAEPRLLRWFKRSVRLGTGPLPLQPGSREQLATIITSHGQQVAAQILAELGRGVTALKGVGGYTGEERDVLLCAVTQVQIPHLKDITCMADPDAFVIVSPAQEVRGGGFRPFEPPS